MLAKRRNWKTIRKIILGIFVLGFFVLIRPMHVEAAVGDEFEDGGIKYKVISEDPMEVEVIANAYSGDITIPAEAGGYAVTGIGESAFKKCSGLTSITIPDSVTTIGKYAFYYCSELKEMNIPNSVTTIGVDTFLGCEKLELITFPENAFFIELPSGICSCCYSLTSVDLPSNIKIIGSAAFEECTRLEKINCLGAVEVIGSNAFRGCANLQEINLTDAVTYIGEAAFDECSSLRSIHLPNNVSYTCIEKETFMQCTSLTSVTIPEQVETIEKSAFQICELLDTVNFSENAKLEKIAENSFTGCDVKTLKIPNSVTTIEKDAFMGCDKLEKVTLPDNEKFITISSTLFWGCTSLTDLQLPDQITNIENSVLKGCSSLSDLVIPNGVTAMGRNIFNDGTALSVDGLTIRYVDSNQSMSDLTTLIQNAGGITDYNDVSSIKNVVIADDVTTIGENAFAGCSGITNLTIPTSVTRIKKGAFTGCTGVSEIIIPDSVTIVEEGAFDTDTTMTIKKENGDVITVEELIAERPEPTPAPAPAPAPVATLTETPIPTPESTETPRPVRVTTEVETEEPSEEPTETPSPEPTVKPSEKPKDKSATLTDLESVMKKLKDGESLTISLDEKGSIIKGDILEQIKGIDAEIRIALLNGIVWKFNGKDIPEDWQARDIDFGVKTESSKIPEEILQNFVGEESAYLLNLVYNGTFGFQMQLIDPVTYQKETPYANLFYYNPETEAFELMGSCEIETLGQAVFSFEHASDYVILLSDHVLIDGERNEKQGSSMSDRTLLVLVLVITCSVIATVSVIIVMKKKDEAEGLESIEI